MPTVNYFIDNSETATPIDVPDRLTPQEQDAWVDRFYLPYHDAGLAAAEKDPEHPLSFLPDWAARGAYRLAQSANIVQTQIGMDAETNAKDIQDYQKHLEKVPYDKPVLDALLKMSDADSIGEFWDAAATLDGLRAIGNVVGESITQFLPVIAASVAALPVIGAAGVTAATGRVILGAIRGLGSTAIEYGASTFEAMNDYLKEKGTNARDDKAVAEVLGNEEKMAEFTKFGLKRGIPIGILEGLSMGFAGKITAALRKARKSAEEAVEITKTQTPTSTTITEIGPKVPSKVPERAALGFEALAMQPALGGLGEAVAQQVAGEEFKLGEIALETIAEIPGGTAEIGIGLALEGRRERKEAEVKALKEQNRVFEERKAELLKQRKGKEEVSMVQADLEQEVINPETGRPDFEEYERVAFNTLDVPVKAGEKSIDRDSIKGWFNGEIKQPKSKNIVMDFFERKGYIEKVKGQYVWTEAAERRAKELEEGGVQTELFTEEEVTATPVVEEVAVSEEVTTPLDPQITSRIDAALGPTPVINNTVIELIDIIRTNFGEDTATQAQEYAQQKMEAAIDQRQEAAPIVEEEAEFKSTEVDEVTPSEFENLEVTTPPAVEPDIIVPEEVDITGLPTQPEITLEEAQASLEELDLDVSPTIDALPIEDPIQLEMTIDLEPIGTKLPNRTRGFVNDSLSPKVRKDIKPFKLRTEGADRDMIRDEFEANIELIRTAQINAIAKTPMNLSKEETDYLQEAFEAESEFIDNIINNNIIATNDKQRDQIKEQNRKQIDNLTGEQLAGTVWKSAYNLWHTTRVAEKFKIYRNYARSIIARREARERYNNIGMVIAAPLYEDISLQESKDLGRMAAVLDALFGINPEKSILTDKGTRKNVEIGEFIKVTIPLEPPTPPVKEGKEAVPIMSTERYKALLKELGVEPGKTYTLNAKLTEKFKTSQSAFKKMFDLNMVSFMNFMLQATPLHEGVTRRYDDTVQTLKEKVFQSVQQYINDINKVLPDDQKIPKETVDSLINVREDTTFVKGAKKEATTTLDNLMQRIPEDDENAKGIVDTLRNQIQIIKLVNDQEKVLKEHPYYLPRLRYGEFFFTVKDKDGEVIGYYTETPSATQLNESMKRKNLNKIREEVKQFYPKSEGFIVGDIQHRDSDEAKAGLDQKTLEKVRKLGQSIGYKTYDQKTPEGEMFKKIDDQLKNVGFGRFLAQRDENVISGYYTPDNRDHYLPIVLSNYIRSAADTASNLDYIRPIQQTIEVLSNGIRDDEGKVVVKPQKTLADHAKQTEDYIKSPNEPGALFKTFAFHYALGGNFSSAFVNLSQSFVTSMPVLSMIIKDGSAIKEVSKGLNDARKLLPTSIKELNDRASTYGFDFSDPNPPKHLTRDEWNMLRKMYEEGSIQAIVNLDLGAKLQQDLGSTLKGKVTDKAAKRIAKASEASSFMFGSVEQINRIAVALATYRLAVKSDKNLNRFQKFSESTLFAEEKMTPERAARMMVYKTQFLIGKENRPVWFRGPIGNVATQFLSFVQQYIGLYAQTLNMIMGKDAESKRMGSVMLGSLMLSMWAFSGMMGWPYLENLRQLLRVSSRNLWDYEFDLEYGMKEAMNSYLNPYVTDYLLHGPFSRLTGIDVRRRIGVGEPIPFNLMQGDLMAATGPAGSLFVDSLKRINEAYKLGDPVMLATAALPLGPRAFMEGLGGAILDKPVRTTQGRVLLPGEEISIVDRLKQMGGFTPMEVGQERERKRVLRYLDTRARPLQDRFMTEMAEKLAAKIKTTSASKRRELTQELNDIRAEIREINREALAEGRRDKIIRVTPRALRERLRVILGGQSDAILRSARKRLGGMQRGSERLDEFVPPLK